jgi:ribosome-binding protein aMBF1 (putative translation factor)
MSPVPMPDLALAVALAEKRVESGLSREALAFRSHTTPRTVDQIEGAQIVPRWDTVRRLTRGLDISLAEFGEAVERHEAAIRAAAIDRPVV